MNTYSETPHTDAGRPNNIIGMILAPFINQYFLAEKTVWDYLVKIQ